MISGGRSAGKKGYSTIRLYDGTSEVVNRKSVCDEVLVSQVEMEMGGR
jgi:hypothetical protein